MSDLKQFHLVGPGFSGRGVRVRELTSAMRADAHVEAARGITEPSAMGSASRFDSSKTFWCVAKIVAEVTDPVTAADLMSAKWRAVSQMDLTTEGPSSVQSLFTPKDVDVFTRYIQNTYYASVGEADAILGGMVAVSVG